MFFGTPTLRYACDTFEWTPEAAKWITNEIAAESVGPERSGTSYYQVIEVGAVQVEFSLPIV
jgi:hypothetical protein